MIKHEWQTILRNGLVINCESGIIFRAGQLNFLWLFIIEGDIDFIDSFRSTWGGASLLLDDLVINLSVEMPIGNEF